ncbi:MAG: hypothetical protein PHN72_01835 [Bacilli bacterium]|nr:hypothetical protein [Bacilli bacterium]
MFVLFQNFNLFKQPAFYFTCFLLVLYLGARWIYKLDQKREKSKPVLTPQDFLNLYTHKIKGYKKVIIVGKNEVLLLSEFGFYFFYLYTENGLITGKYQKEWLIRKPDNISLPNPFNLLNEALNKVLLIKEISCQKVFVIKEACHFLVTDYKDEILVHERYLVPKIERHMGQKAIYSKEEIDELYNLYTVNLCQKKTNDLH